MTKTATFHDLEGKSVFITGGGAGNVAWWAHIGGMICGAALIPFFKSRHVGLFGAGHLSPRVAHPAGPPIRKGPIAHRLVANL